MSDRDHHHEQPRGGFLNNLTETIPVIRTDTGEQVMSAHEGVTIERLAEIVAENGFEVSEVEVGGVQGWFIPKP